MTPVERHRQAYERVTIAVRRWTEARARWDREGGDLADYERDVQPWADSYDRSMQEADAAWRAL